MVGCGEERGVIVGEKKKRFVREEGIEEGVG